MSIEKMLEELREKNKLAELGGGSEKIEKQEIVISTSEKDQQSKKKNYDNLEQLGVEQGSESDLAKYTNKKTTSSSATLAYYSENINHFWELREKAGIKIENSWVRNAWNKMCGMA